MSAQSSKQQGRLELIDFLRGIAVLEMLAAHFASYFPPSLSKLVDYTETAMALFVLLAGFMVGWLWQKFAREPMEQTRVLWGRALRILLAQYIIVLTVGVPLHLLGMPGTNAAQPLGLFLFQSFAFLNQISLLHILPTFIPLFLVSPAILWALCRGSDVIVLSISAMVFCVGLYDPHILDLGQPTIFPFVLFQLYFVVGCLIGKKSQLAGTVFLPNPRKWLTVSVAVLLITMLLVHTKVVPVGLISTHPLNIFGLLYHAPLLSTVCLLPMALWPWIQHTWVYPYVTRFGRHALLAFVIHLYTAKLIGVANFLSAPSWWVNYLLIALSLMAMNAVIEQYERRRAQEHRPAWTRVLSTLFG